DDNCRNIQCMNGGSKVDGIGGCFCRCPVNYGGSDCSINGCTIEPTTCQNGGTPVSMANGCVCQCPDGTRGETCQYVNDECSSNPCGNGGLCIDGMKQYYCECQYGFGGVNCATSKCPQNSLFLDLHLFYLFFFAIQDALNRWI
ncbi:hypothetical protein CAPTEDRAFT_111043, partial [Capitella teleta]